MGHLNPLPDSFSVYKHVNVWVDMSSHTTCNREVRSLCIDTSF